MRGLISKWSHLKGDFRFLLVSIFLVLFSIGISGWGAYRQQISEDTRRFWKIRAIAEKGHVWAQYELGIMYYKGEGVIKNWPERRPNGFEKRPSGTA